MNIYGKKECYQIQTGSVCFPKGQPYGTAFSTAFFTALCVAENAAKREFQPRSIAYSAVDNAAKGCAYMVFGDSFTSSQPLGFR